MFDTVLLREPEKIRVFVNFPRFGSGLSGLRIRNYELAAREANS
jgi:hypothetical protein